MSNRVKTYGQISTDLACLSDRQMYSLLATAKPLQTGIGGSSLLLEVAGSPVFVKRVPLTWVERQAENVFSTANVFGLPLFCQYGIGSPGFGAWRELLAHIMATNWVISGGCASFPLLYHWRILPVDQPQPMCLEEWGDLDSYVKFWNNCSALRHRVESINESDSTIVLFLEFISTSLYEWLLSRISEGGPPAAEAIDFAEKSLKVVNDFMAANDFLHFDAHFKNILTDGNLIYLTDFGLATSLKFELSPEEIDFFKFHRSYDRCSAAMSLVHCIIRGLFKETEWKHSLDECLSGNRGLNAPFAAVIERYASITLVMNEFYHQLKKDAKATRYPDVELEGLLSRLEHSM